MHEERMSEYFLRVANDGHESWYPEYEGESVEEAEFDRRDQIVELLIECRERITTGGPSLDPLDEFVEENRDRAEDWLDSHYSISSLPTLNT